MNLVEGYVMIWQDDGLCDTYTPNHRQMIFQWAPWSWSSKHQVRSQGGMTADLEGQLLAGLDRRQ